MRVSLHQVTTGPDPVANVGMVAAGIAAAAKAGAVLCCFPEAVNVLRGKPADLRRSIPDAAECPVLAEASAAAKAHGIQVHLGSLLLREPSGRLLNRSYLIDADGGIVCTYDKIHLFDADLGDGSPPESELFAPGEEAVVVDTPAGRIGMTICFDLRFPHLFAALAEAGAEIILVPSSFSTVTGPVHWLPLLQARAIETGCYVLAAAQHGGHEPPLETHGHSAAASPWGEILALAEGGPRMLLVDIDPGAVREARRRIPTLALRRPLRVRVAARAPDAA